MLIIILFLLDFDYIKKYCLNESNVHQICRTISFIIISSCQDEKILLTPTKILLNTIFLSADQEMNYVNMFKLIHITSLQLLLSLSYDCAKCSA